MTTIEFRTQARNAMLDITEALIEKVAQSGISEGLITVQPPHTTLGVTVNENADPDVVDDMLGHLSRLVPQDPQFHHREGNSDSHLKVSLIGPSVTLIIHDGRLLLGTWQGVYACEFDGPRRRHLWVQIVGS